MDTDRKFHNFYWDAVINQSIGQVETLASVKSQRSEEPGGVVRATSYLNSVLSEMRE